MSKTAAEYMMKALEQACVKQIVRTQFAIPWLARAAML